ncbi:hypothetical protein LSH36_214g00025 [Paralvinella palmiformis]|uniref:Uncharacterized protein n=1 Tax=Paralvinella palmiformis TaxID=53620 RepID=A0AAD9JNN6_9ANNE|nr:hypothetical protein LSH36_214g00025 [Paralvinella palmiformis]
MDSSVEHQDIQSNPELNRSVDSSSSNSYVSDNEITGNWDTVQDGEVDPIGYQQKQYYFADQDNKQLKLAESDKSDQYILRSARHPDPLHFIHRVKLLSSDVDPEMVLRIYTVIWQ